MEKTSLRHYDLCWLGRIFESVFKKKKKKDENKKKKRWIEKLTATK
mgnify:CR=1 FL=1